MSCSKVTACGKGGGIGAKIAKMQAQAKRAAIRKAAKAARACLRKKVRCGGAVIVALLSLALLGCNTATPASKSAATKACDNITTINNYIGVLPNGATNGLALAGGLTISVSDLNGTIAQSADTAGGDRTDLTAAPSMAAGITGDAPIQAMADAAMAFANPSDAISAAVSALAAKFGWGATTNAVIEAVEGAAPSE